MKHAYREIGKIVLAGIVMVSLTAFVAKGWLLRELGNKMDIPHREYEKYQDFASTKAVCGREAPEIVRKGSWRQKQGEAIPIADMFEGTDAEGNPVEIELVGIWYEGKNSRMEHYQREGKRLAGMESWIYLLELRAMDGERRTAIGRFGLLVEGNI